MWRAPCLGVICQLPHLSFFLGSQSCTIASPVGTPGHIISSSILPNSVFTLVYYYEQLLHWIPCEWKQTTKINMRRRCIHNLPHGTHPSLLRKAKQSGAMMRWAVDNQSYARASSTYNLYITQLFVFLSLRSFIAQSVVIVWCQSNTKTKDWKYDQLYVFRFFNSIMHARS